MLNTQKSFSDTLATTLIEKVKDFENKRFREELSKNSYRKKEMTFRLSVNNNYLKSTDSALSKLDQYPILSDDSSNSKQNKDEFSTDSVLLEDNILEFAIEKEHKIDQDKDNLINENKEIEDHNTELKISENSEVLIEKEHPISIKKNTNENSKAIPNEIVKKEEKTTTKMKDVNVKKSDKCDNDSIKNIQNVQSDENFDAIPDIDLQPKHVDNPYFPQIPFFKLKNQDKKTNNSLSKNEIITIDASNETDVMSHTPQTRNKLVKKIKISKIQPIPQKTKTPSVVNEVKESTQPAYKTPFSHSESNMESPSIKVDKHESDKETKSSQKTQNLLPTTTFKTEKSTEMGKGEKKDILNFIEKVQIEKWSSCKLDKVLFDTSVDSAEKSASLLHTRFEDVEKSVFLIEDDQLNLFGGVTTKKIKLDEFVDDKNAFLFSLRSNGRLGSPMKFDMKKSESETAIFVGGESSFKLFKFGDGDVEVGKMLIRKNVGVWNCILGQSSYEYGKVRRALTGTTKSKLKRISVYKLVDK
ncbi:hypothetical protein EIN_306030 [Entamoeba invadens IP1]|uniref:TLDc domain-containing protein n=1 Tax=Entamoeba invadens IP1 TaxID=370355 RepID=A0A0A1TYT0_ENTIV|nr:hypothetical protein EIN_306030 [Entamoeba invadens IP1]ELP86707.1 hypothetical protein EIN_306030 [Entamoeba invadens IP1]|eukprot:XP_004186053.1 hypothetical protein EIN_306030 [Entamoeba invadens IP1]